MYQIIQVESQEEFEDFLAVPTSANDRWRKNKPLYDLELEELSNNLDKRPGFEAAYFIAYDGRQLAGRMAAFINPEAEGESEGGRTGNFGLFEAVNDINAVRMLFSEAADWFVDRGCARVEGPGVSSSLFSFGLLISGLDDEEEYLLGYNPAYYADLLEHCGFKKARDYFCWRFPINGELERLSQEAAARHPPPSDFLLRSLNSSEFDCEFKKIVALINASRESGKEAFAVREDNEELIKRQLAGLLEEELSIIAEASGRLAGVCMAIPDLRSRGNEKEEKSFIGSLLNGWGKRGDSSYGERIYHLGVDEEYRSRAEGSLAWVMFAEHVRRALQRGLKWGEITFISERNKQVNDRLRKYGGEIRKIYRVYGKELEK